MSSTANSATNHTNKAQQNIGTRHAGTRRWLLLSFAMVFTVLFVALSQWLSVHTERQSLVRMADSYSSGILSMRAFYAQNVVGRLAGHPDVLVTHDYMDHPHAIPIPATLTLDLVDYMNQEDLRISIAQVSRHPFPWREGRELTPFQQDALALMEQTNETEFYRVDRDGSGLFLHHAKAIRMEPSCVACHNYHPDSPKTDWQVGDLRAIQVISLPTNDYLDVGLMERGIWIMALFVLLSFAIGFVTLYRTDRKMIHALQLAEQREEEREDAMKALHDRQFALDEHAIVSIADRAGRITYANQRFCDISGYRIDELLGQNHRMVKSDVHPAEFYREMWQTISAGKIWRGEICNRKKQGGFYWVAATIVPFLDERGKPIQYISLRTDISQRKEIEVQLTEQGRFLSVMTDALGEGVYALDKHGHCTFLNPEGARMLGWTTEDLEGKKIHDIIHYQTADGSHLPACDCPIMLATSAGEVFKSDREVFMHRNGTPIPVSASSVPMYDKGVVIGSVTVFSDIREMKQREQALLEASQKAEKANRAKSEFLSSMSHELRTPLNAILGFGQLLHASRKEPLSERQQEYLQHIMKSGQHLLNLINEVLDLSRVESGHLTLSIEQVCITDVVRESLEVIAPQANAYSITLKPAELDGDLYARADYTRLKQVLLNFLSNAIKYNRPQGSVILRAYPGETGNVRLEVEDTGSGIPEERLGELFQPFSRLDAESSGIEGTGIGLALTRRIVEAMDGHVGVHSVVDQGTIFWLELPGCETEATAQERALFEAGEARATDGRESHDGNTRQRILLVEDNPVNLRLMEELLTNLTDYGLITAHNAELGIELAKVHNPDLIIMDINLPGMDGVQAMEILREDAKTSHIPVIALSANAMEHDIQRGMRAGFRAYLTKPVVINQLIDTLKRELNGEA